MTRTIEATKGRTGAIVLAILLLGVGGGLLTMAAEPSLIAWVEIENETCEVVNDTSADADRCTLSGFDRHGGAFLLLGVLAIGLAVVAARGGPSTAVGVALLAIGVVVLAITLIGDLPETNRTGGTGPQFESAVAHAGYGFHMELLGGTLCLLAGALQLVSGRGASAAAPDRSRG